MGGVDFAQLKYIIQEASAETAEGAGDAVAEVAISYGQFLNTIITFLIVAFAIFMVVKMYNKMKDQMAKKEAAAPAAPSKEEVLLTEIRDLLKK